jgi:tetratricopeptide (TPR) repeat protein
LDVWEALQYVGTGLSLVAFAIAAILLAYRVRLTQRAEIIKSAPEKERLEAIAATAEFFRVDVSGLTRVQQQDIALTQIHARSRRDLLLAGVSLVVAMLLAAIAIATIWASKPAGPATVVNSSGSGITSGRDTVINAPVNIGLDEEQVARRIAETQKPLDEKLERILALKAREKGVEADSLRAILVKMGEAGVRDDDIPRRLDEKADELLKLRAESDRLRRGPAELASFAEQAETLINKGDFDAARAALSAGRATARTVREQSSRYEADFLAQEARVDHLQLAYRQAAAKYAEAAGLMAAVDQQKQWEFLLDQADEFYSQGDEFGDNAALVEAIKVYRNSLLLASRAQRPRNWAATQNNLGNALVSLGERGSGTARLEEAVVAYRDALTERTRERVPLDWSQTQNNLGNALLRLGERESGTARLEEAVAAYRDALKEYTRDRAPLDWAMTQNNLGNALQTLGKRGGGTTQLEEAIAAFRDALKERTRDRVPLEWAMTQHNLGTALRALGERESGTTRLEEAVVAYRDALKERTRDRVPLEWAMTQHNLGNVLRALGKRESGTKRLEEAVTAHHNALMEMTRDRVPLGWAMSFGDEGETLMDLAERSKNLAMAETALRQIEVAFEVLHTAGHASATDYDALLPTARRIRDALKVP